MNIRQQIIAMSESDGSVALVDMKTRINANPQYISKEANKLVGEGLLVRTEEKGKAYFSKPMPEGFEHGPTAETFIPEPTDGVGLEWQRTPHLPTWIEKGWWQESDGPCEGVYRKRANGQHCLWTFRSGMGSIVPSQVIGDYVLSQRQMLFEARDWFAQRIPQPEGILDLAACITNPLPWDKNVEERVLLALVNLRKFATDSPPWWWLRLDNFDGKYRMFNPGSGERVALFFGINRSFRRSWVPFSVTANIGGNR